MSIGLWVVVTNWFIIAEGCGVWYGVRFVHLYDHSGTDASGMVDANHGDTDAANRFAPERWYPLGW